MAKRDWADKELAAQYCRASSAGRRAAQAEPRAARVTYSTRAAALRILLTNGATLVIPVKLIETLRGATAQELRSVEVLGAGGGLHWESLDLDLSVPALVAAVCATPTVRRNGHKGGRARLSPRSSVPPTRGRPHRSL
jgi:hypothetical protein